MSETAGSTDPVQQRRHKLEELKKLGVDPYPHKYEFSHTPAQIVSSFSARTAEQLGEAKAEVRTAGRLVALRGHGKASFGHLAGGGEKIQIYVRQDRVGEANYEVFRLLDVGDLVGVRGEMFRTRTGELTVFADEIQLLAKSLLPLPEKWHGLQDVELRYRQRYLDLIANPAVRAIFERRSRIIGELRSFLEEHGYLEVETPMMHPIASGAAARPFKTFHEALGIPLYLRIAPELYLKRLTVGGFDRVYEINRNFRNEGISTQHNPEFTMLEFYVAYSDYQDLMDFTEAMLSRLAERVLGSLQTPFGEHVIDFGSFARYSMTEAIAKHWPGDRPPTAEELADSSRLRALLREVGAEYQESDGWGKLLGLLFETVAEEHLIQPTFIYDFPVELSPLSKKKDSDPRFVERFELFVGGFELANAYSELNDPEEQLERFRAQAEKRARGDADAQEADEDFVHALRYGLPPTAGEGVGIDRLTMVLTNSKSIREVILFPQLRPEGS